MRVKTLIATDDAAYTEHISEYISEYHADTMEISVCNTIDLLREKLTAKRYDVALMDGAFIRQADLEAVNLPMLLWSEHDSGSALTVSTPTTPMRRIRKHRRISSIVADVLEEYAMVTGDINIAKEKAGNITACWSPCGGVGTTTVALAYAAANVLREKEVFYLNLEGFCSTPVYFSNIGKSISSVFEMLENNSGNVKMFVQGISVCENGIKYLCLPDNYDDVSILTDRNIQKLLTCLIDITGELVVDLSCGCDMRTRQVFELADKVLLVTDSTTTAQAKMTQFVSHSNVFEGIKEKTTFVVNKERAVTANAMGAIAVNNLPDSIIQLPHIKETDPQFIYKALAKSFR